MATITTKPVSDEVLRILRGGKQIGVGAYNYVKTHTPGEAWEDTKSLGKGIATYARENPGEFAAGFIPYVGGALDAKDTYEARERGDDAMYAAGLLGFVPGARVVKKGAKVAKEAAELKAAALRAQNAGRKVGEAIDVSHATAEEAAKLGAPGTGSLYLGALARDANAPKGTGRKMLDAALAESDAAGLPMIVSSADEGSGKLHKFYEDAGFTRTGQGDVMVRAPKKAEKPPKPKALGQLFDDVTAPEARAMALRGEHLREKKGGGGYTAAPEHITGPEALDAQRAIFDAHVDRGAAIPGAKTWYEDSRRVAEDFAGPDPTKQSLFARGGAGYSNQLPPDQELGGFTTQHNERVLTGRDVKPFTPDKMENLKRAYPEYEATGKFTPEEISLGNKTGAYGDARDPTKPMSELYRAPLDLWQGRAQGFPDGTSYGDTHHNYSWGENLTATERANARAAARGEAADFHPNSTQSSAWVGARKQDYIDEKLKSAALRGEKVDMDALTKEAEEYALGDIRAAANRNSAYLTKEARTGAGVGHLTMDDPEQIAEYSRRVEAIGGGRDPIADALDLYSSGPQSTRGYYPNEAGVVEKNPGFANQVLVGSDLSSGAPKTRAADRAALDFAAQHYAFTHGQEAAAHSRFFPEGMGKQKVSDMNAVLLGHGPLDADSWDKLGESAGRAGASPINWGERTLITRFGDEGPVPGTTKEITEALRAGGQQGKAVRGTAETFYDPTQLTDQTDTGVATTKYLADAEKAGGTIRDLEARTAGNVAAEAKALNALDDEIAQTTGLKQRASLRKVRDILATGGIPALREYVRKYGAVGLPTAAAVAVGLTAAGEQAGGEGA